MVVVYRQLVGQPVNGFQDFDSEFNFNVKADGIIAHDVGSDNHRVNDSCLLERRCFEGDLPIACVVANRSTARAEQVSGGSNIGVAFHEGLVSHLPTASGHSTRPDGRWMGVDVVGPGLGFVRPHFLHAFCYEAVAFGHHELLADVLGAHALIDIGSISRIYLSVPGEDLSDFAFEFVIVVGGSPGANAKLVVVVLLPEGSICALALVHIVHVKVRCPVVIRMRPV